MCALFLQKVIFRRARSVIASILFPSSLQFHSSAVACIQSFCVLLRPSPFGMRAGKESGFSSILVTFLIRCPRFCVPGKLKRRLLLFGADGGQHLERQVDMNFNEGGAKI